MAFEEEAYEEAARIRDQIKALQEKPGAEGREKQ
jgi:protein-arginine kinase activator protein McsA